MIRATLMSAALVFSASAATAQTNSTNGSNPNSVGGMPVTNEMPGTAGGRDTAGAANQDPNPSNSMSDGGMSSSKHGTRHMAAKKSKMSKTSQSPQSPQR